MKIGRYFLGLNLRSLVGLVACGLVTAGHLPAEADGHEGGREGNRKQAHRAYGEGTSLIEPGVLTEFEFDKTEVECKVEHAVMPDGTVMQMFMFSTSVDSVTIDSEAKTVTITGSMVSITKLRFPDGSAVRLRETVPYVAYAEDNGTPGAGADFFSLAVIFKDTPGLDQFDLFGSHATFAGTLVSGNVTIR